MQAVALLERIWRQSCRENDFVFLSTKSLTGQWSDHPFVYGSGLAQRLEQWFERYPSHKFNIYFSPRPFSEKRRRKEFAKPARLLWADIDLGNPHKIEPTILWESSPGRHQALWFIQERLTVEAGDALGKQLTQFIDADKAGYDVTQVLRIPWTLNLKYDDHPQVRLVTKKGPEYTRQKLLDLTAKKESKVELSGDDHINLVNKYADRIPLKAKNLLLKKSATVGKRSDVIWSLENSLHEAGLAPNEIITLIRGSAWNKYKGRHDEDLRLRTELEKILKLDPTTEEEQEKPSHHISKSLTVESYADVMGAMHTSPGWLVDGFWMKQSHGIVAGEPKSFKSTLALDMAVSVASGKPFLGQYRVDKPGPVVYIQNENARWIIQDRIGKIISNKELVGTVTRNGKKSSLTVEWAPDLPLFCVNQQSFSLTDVAHQKLLEQILERFKPELLILDPLYLLFDGDLNSSKELNPILSWLIELRTRFHCSICVVHHWKKSNNLAPTPRGGQRMLGSTTLHGWIESAWYISVTESELEESDSDDVNKPASSASIILDREFRGAGLHPKVDVNIKMGQFGDPEYGVEVEVHKEVKDLSERKLTDKQLDEEILNTLRLFKNGINEAKLRQRTGLTEEKLRSAIDRLCEKDKVRRRNGVIMLEKEDDHSSRGD